MHPSEIVTAPTSPRDIRSLYAVVANDALTLAGTGATWAAEDPAESLVPTKHKTAEAAVQALTLDGMGATAAAEEPTKALVLTKRKISAATAATTRRRSARSQLWTQAENRDLRSDRTLRST